MRKCIEFHNEEDCQKVQELLGKNFQGIPYTILEFAEWGCRVESIHQYAYEIDFKSKKILHGQKEILLTESVYKILELLQEEKGFFTVEEISYALCIDSLEEVKKLLLELKNAIPGLDVLEYAQNKVRWKK